MLDWCRCVCKRAGQHQCFDSGSSAPIISPPAAEPLPPWLLPAHTYQPPSLLRGHHVSRSFVPLSLSLCICLSFHPASPRSPVSPSFPRIMPYTGTAQSLSNFHPGALRYFLSLPLYRSRNDTIALSLSSRGRKLSPHTRIRTRTRVPYPVCVYVCGYKRYLSIWASVYR